MLMYNVIFNTLQIKMVLKLTTHTM